MVTEKIEMNQRFQVVKSLPESLVNMGLFLFLRAVHAKEDRKMFFHLNLRHRYNEITIYTFEKPTWLKTESCNLLLS